jgi:PAS domain S-box-containing protein
MPEGNIDMFKERFHKSIRFKFLIAMTVTLFASTLTLSLVIAVKEERMHRHSLTSKGQSFASYMAKLSQEPLITEDRIRLDAIVNDANHDENIAYSIIRDAQGAPLTTQYASINYRLPNIKAVLFGLSGDNELQDIIAAIKKKESVIEISTPVMAGLKTIGIVTIGMSKRQLHQEIVKTIIFIIALNLAGAFVLGVVLFSASKKIVFNQLVELAHASSRLAKGDLSTQVKVRATGEMKTLVDSFNKMTEQLLKTTVSRDYVDNIIGTMADSLVVLNPDGNISTVNEATYKLLGYEEEELIGKNISLIIPEEGEKFIGGRLEKAIKKGPIRDHELTYKAKDGRIIPMILSTAVIEKVDCPGNGPSDDCAEFKAKGLHCGCLVGIVWVARDNTERKQAEEALRESEERYRTILENIEDGYYEVDLEGNFTFFNDSLCTMLGYSRGELMGMNSRQYTDQENAKKLYQTFNTVFSTGEPAIAFDWEVIRKDGTRRIGEISVSLIKDSKGKPHGFRGIARDITERRRAEEEIKRERQRFQTLIENAPFGIIIVDQEGKFTYINSKLKELFGYDLDDIPDGRTWFRKAYPDSDYRHRVIAAWKGSLNYSGAMGRESGTFTVKCKDGSEKIIYFFVPVQLETGENLVACEDITERRKAEEELRRAKEATELAKDELENTNQKLEQAIEHANQMAIAAEMANQAKSEFLANMSHEIRTPMNGIVGMTGLLLDTELNPEQREYAETVRQCGDSLLTIINDILDFSKIEARKLELETLDFDLRSTLEDMGDMMAMKADEKGLEFTCVIEPEVPSLLQGDPGRLRQMLINLMGNAIKFTSKGEVAVHVSLKEEREDQATLRFAIKDTGIGIPEDRIDSLFRPFTQVDASTTRQYGGTGLGLSISKRITELMGGRIGVESEEGKGSTFWFTVVLGKQPSVSEPVELTEDLKGVRILIVDDNETNRRALSARLKKWDCRWDEAPEAETALKKLHEASAGGDPFRIAILDMVMPGMSGEDVGMEIKKDPILSNTILVMMTSFGKRGDASRFEKIGFSAYLTKPIKHTHLYDCLKMVLKRDFASVDETQKRIITRHTVSEVQKQKIRILLAEDNIVNQKVALKIIEKLGYRADAVANGLEAIKALEMMPYDLILMDVQMPEMDGLEATRQIRSPQSPIPNHDIPIIAMTAHAMKGDMEMCLEAGMNDYLSKPVKPEQLAQAIERWVSDRDLARTDREDGTASKKKIVFDKTGSLSLLGGDEELLKEILALYLEDAPRQIDALKEAIEKGDAAFVQRHAHTLKGSSGNVGAVLMQEVAYEMEKAGKAGNFHRAASLLEKMEKEFDDLKRVMGHEMKMAGNVGRS